MPRAHTQTEAELPTQPGRPKWAAWLSVVSLLSLAPLGCSLAGEGTGGERDIDRAPVDGLDADLRDPNALLQDARVGDARTALRDATSEPPDGQVHDGATPDAGKLADGSAPSLDAALDAASPDAGADGSADVNVPPPDCDLAGIYALRVDFDVSWEGTAALDGLVPILAPGTGVLTMFASVDMKPGKKKKGSAEVAPCGTTIPDFEAGQNLFQGELYSAYVPDAAWESPGMPRWTVPWEAGCELTGCVFKAERLVALLGARNVPAVAPDTMGTLALSDDDRDGQPSITFLMRGPDQLSPSGVPYTYPPLITPWARAHKLMLAIGLSAQFDGAISGCGQISGNVKLPQVEQGAVGCAGYTDGVTGEEACDAGYTSFINDNLPYWTVLGARFKAQRVANATCSTVRAALP